jgi:hypothetical protein
MPLLKGSPSAVPGGLMARFAELRGWPAAISRVAARRAIPKATNFLVLLFIVVNSPMKKCK